MSTQICRLLVSCLLVALVLVQRAAATPRNAAAYENARDPPPHNPQTSRAGYGANTLENVYYNQDTPKQPRPAKPNRQPNRYAATQQQNGRNQQQEASENLVDWDKNMCKIWVPEEAVRKHPLARVIQRNQALKVSLIEVCCKGYGPVRWQGNTLCEPLCENCRNGFCVAPDQCRCYEGFVSNDNGDCVFTCPLGCLNGRCYLDGSCQCDPGYKLDETRQYCRPICGDYCNLSPKLNCTAPDVCGCAKGYRLDADGCQPMCALDCGVGGTCREPNVCECNGDYKNVNGVCLAECYQTCANGMCISSNRCVCNPGFVYHERSTQCIPA